MEDSVISSKAETPQAIEGRAVLKVKYVRLCQTIVGWIVLIVGLWAFIESRADLLFGEGWSWVSPTVVFAIASGGLMMMFPKRETPLASEDKSSVRAGRRPWLPEWSLLVYCIVVGLGFDWSCALLCLSGRYALLSGPVIGVAGATAALCAATGFLVVRLTREKRVTVAPVFALLSLLSERVAWTWWLHR